MSEGFVFVRVDIESDHHIVAGLKRIYCCRQFCRCAVAVNSCFAVNFLIVAVVCRIVGIDVIIQCAGLLGKVLHSVSHGKLVVLYLRHDKVECRVFVLFILCLAGGSLRVSIALHTYQFDDRSGCLMHWVEICEVLRQTQVDD